MTAFLLRRLLVIIPTLLFISVVVFALTELMPGDPALTILGETATAEQAAAVRDELGLEDPILERYVDWLGNTVQGDLGSSLFSGQGVIATIGQHLEVTLALTAIALGFTVLFGGIFGVLAATRRGTLVDRAVSIFAACAIAAPSFWIGLLLVVAFAVQRPWFAASGYVSPTTDFEAFVRSITLPALTLALPAIAVVARQLRGELSAVLNADYIEAAEAKGLTRRQVVFKHALRNALAPVVTVLGVQVAAMVGGAIIIEKVFALPGVGTLAINSITQHDIPMIQGIVLLSATAVLVINLLVDISYAVLNPRVRPA